MNYIDIIDSIYKAVAPNVEEKISSYKWNIGINVLNQFNKEAINDVLHEIEFEVDVTHPDIIKLARE